jgi:hypothetical protein
VIAGASAPPPGGRAAPVLCGRGCGAGSYADAHAVDGPPPGVCAVPLHGGAAHRLRREHSSEHCADAIDRSRFVPARPDVDSSSARCSHRRRSAPPSPARAHLAIVESLLADPELRRAHFEICGTRSRSTPSPVRRSKARVAAVLDGFPRSRPHRHRHRWRLRRPRRTTVLDQHPRVVSADASGDGTGGAFTTMCDRSTRHPDKCGERPRPTGPTSAP